MSDAAADSSGRGLSGRVAVIQPLPGMGDMIWHLPHIAAVARRTVSGKVTLIAKPTSMARDLFAGHPILDELVPIDPAMRDPISRAAGLSGLLRLIERLRAGRFDSAVLLHHSRTLSFALFAAGIPNRFGYGFKLQRPFLNRPPFLRPVDLRLHPFWQATAYLTAAGWAPEEAEPQVAVLPGARRTVAERLAGLAAPIVALGIGSSESYKQWGADNFASLGASLRAAGWPMLAVIGGAAEAPLVEALAATCSGSLRVIDWRLDEVGALLQRAAFYVGNDTGIMNLAAAVGCRSYGLFGATRPPDHSRHIVAVLPPGGHYDREGGMGRITPDAVLAAIVADRGRIAP